ncbi:MULTISPECIES: diacylglycerol/lipid kinase family protein [Alteribacter]|uniref:Diacylglycerol kinase family lipid kinase n=1 Tax=Alteribacter keqinensis TaxID=2483800 RepID=A0A3M7TY06_9BACI|nr:MULTISPECIES: diacylglycerol kinase family protein [Alteribacter]MBM7096307.1 diacylglycerol kinase family lipid kinase [Alteribacter salitolerans]RNA70467.1 diacylglycerol kinase family lipid kinase [Alteribacter keqinensis]
MLYFLINPNAGNGKGKRVWHGIKHAVDKRDEAYIDLWTRFQGHSEELLREIEFQKGDRVIVIGGDGTVHEVLNALAEKTVPVGIIPAGSGNDFARGLKIPSETGEALHKSLEGNVVSIDAGFLGDRLFITAAGAGFDGEVAKITNRSWYKKWFNKINAGHLSYLVSVIRVLIGYKPTSVTLKVDGQSFTYNRVWLIATANMPFYGGGIMICPDATETDGKLDVCVIHGVNKLKAITVLPKALKGSHVGSKGVTVHKGEKIGVTSNRPMTIQCDGEMTGSTPAQIRLQRKAVMVIK